MEKFVQVEEQLRNQSAGLNSREEYLAWEKQCNELLESLKERSRVKRPRLPTGVQQSLVLRIANLESLKDSLRRRFEHEGAGHSNTELSWRLIETAFNSRVLTGVIVNSVYIGPRKFLEDARSIVLQHVRDALETHNCLKVNTVLNGEFVAGDKRLNKSIQTKNFQLFRTYDLDKWYERDIVDPTLASLEEFKERDSGWALSRILNLVVNVNKYNTLRAGCHFKLPREIYLKRATISVQSNDNACFAWAVAAGLNPVERNAERPSSYPNYKNLKLQNIEFPMSLHQITEFERLNEISVNVYSFKEESEGTSEETAKGERHRIFSLHLTNQKRDNHVNLLYMQGQGDRNLGHFAWIKELSRLLSMQLSKHKESIFICDRCMHYFNSKEKLVTHTVDCTKVNDSAIVLPSGDNKWLSFNNYNRKERIPFVVYADLECTLKKMGDNQKEVEEEHTSYAYQHHEVFSIGYYVHCSYDTSLSMYRCRRDADCVSWFVQELRNLAHSVKPIFSNDTSMTMLTENQEEIFVNATNCHICEKPYAESDERVRDHCHLSGRFRGSAHSSCNLNYKNAFYIPIVFHNLSGYDSHFIIEEIATAFEGSVTILPITNEKYTSFTKNVQDTGTAEKSEWRNCIKLRFIDSYKFLNTSLDKLASFLSVDKLKILRSQFEKLSANDFNLLTRKGVFPYEYLDCENKLQDSYLPPRDSFYSSLTGETVSESDYAHAGEVWRRFNIKTLGEYSDLYLKTDVLLLADIFETFRESCIESYGLDPAHYYTLPGFTWDAMLKHTKIKLELLTDVDMVMFIERGIRGGLSQCSGRYAQANNKYMHPHDLSKPSSYLMYFDVNNLYGWAMSQPLPCGKFQWVEDVENFDVSSIAVDSPTGYILEVDLEYPQRLHGAHADLPFCPTRAKPPGNRQDKLLATLINKQRYVIHYRNLQQCTNHGLIITKKHRILQFAQSPWLRDYIELNTRFRTSATNDFEKNLYKLMNNAVYGKTMENVRNYKDVKLLTNWDGRYGVEAMMAKPNFHSRSVFSENLIAVQLHKLEVKFNKPIYVGMCILDISKTCLYEFHYDYMLQKYGKNCKLMYTDTDSLIYHINCEDIYVTMKQDIHMFDTSDYPDGNVYNIPLTNKKIPGLMKDENNGAIMREFVGIRSKMYALRVDGKQDTKKAKGVKTNVVDRTITFDDYMECLQNKIEMVRPQSYIRSNLHKVYTVFESKIALSPYDDKRYIVPDSTDTLPWGHCEIPNRDN